MTSQLNVDTIVDKAGSGGTNVKMANTSTYVSDGGATTKNTVQGLCKAWISLVQDSSHSINDSFNIGSIADNGAGETTCNYTTAMGNSNYAVAIARGNNQNRTVMYNGNNTTRLKLEGFEHASINSTTDCPHCGATVHGDLA